MTAREIGRLYRFMEPGEKLAGVSVTVVGGRTTYRMVLERADGSPRYVTYVINVDEPDAGAA